MGLSCSIQGILTESCRIFCGHEFSCLEASGFWVLQPGIEPISSALQVGFLITGPPGKSPSIHFATFCILLIVSSGYHLGCFSFPFIFYKALVRSWGVVRLGLNFDGGEDNFLPMCSYALPVRYKSHLAFFLFVILAAIDDYCLQPVIHYDCAQLSEKAMAPHSSTLAWKIPWTEEPGRLQSMGLLRIRHDWATSLSFFTFMHWRRKWQPTPVFLPGESQGRRSLVGCCLCGHTELDTTEVT